LNLDLIYGLPEQTLASWTTTVRRILDLHPEHISAYALTLEHGTPFGRWASRGLLPVPDPDLAAEMYEWLSETLSENGYIQYEISNWAKDDNRPLTEDRSLSTVYSTPFGGRPPSRACAHNLQYWRGLPYLAAGAGAHGYVNGYRYSNVLRIKTYIERLNTDNWSLFTDFPLTPATVNHHRQSLEDEMGEFMLTGLRLTREGVSTETFRERFGQEMIAVFGKELEDLIRLGLLARQAERLALTRRGRLLGNQVFMRFVG
jgi:oxygen-independent coproporphyrinogen-3 oxidase